MIYEPLKFYSERARDEHKRNLTEHFDSLLSRSGVNVEENRRGVAEYDNFNLNIKKLSKKITGLKVAMGFLIALSVLGIISLFAAVFMFINESSLAVPFLIFGIIASPLGFSVAFTVIKKKIKKLKEELTSLSEKRDAIYAKLLAEMAPLNALFDGADTLRLIEKTVPDIKFDTEYTNEREEELITEYDYVDLTDLDTSVIDVLSGRMFGNPFLFERYREFRMGTKTYHGTLTISWTESYIDSKGNRRTRRRTQVLHAEVTKPAPEYTVETHLGFGSSAAPDLSFSRNESDTDELSEAALARRIRAGEKKLRKRAREAVMNSDSFQEMSNSEFDVLFGAHDRDHEVQFRLMYTPLAQNNTVDLLRSNEGFGDDFNFIKRGRFNIVKSNHAKSWDMDLSAKRYASHSVDLARSSFIDFNTAYFKSVFFDLAPLMAVPAYHDEPVESMKKPKEYKGNYTSYEHEILANRIGEKYFRPEDARTMSILKTHTVEKCDGVDRVAVTAYSFRAEDRVDFVPVFGGDGRMHLVSVPWIEYIPTSKTSEMLVKSLGHTERELRYKSGGLTYPQSAYLHGLMAYTSSTPESFEDAKKVFDKFI